MRPRPPSPAASASRGPDCERLVQPALSASRSTGLTRHPVLAAARRPLTAGLSTAAVSFSGDLHRPGRQHERATSASARSSTTRTAAGVSGSLCAWAGRKRLVQPPGRLRRERQRRALGDRLLQLRQHTAGQTHAAARSLRAVTTRPATRARRASALNYDATPPSVTGAAAERPPDGNGWYNHPVAIAFTGRDDTSGVAALHECDLRRPGQLQHDGDRLM